ncbi:MAG TPA: class I SAM-dependent methyltransferase [Gaiellaceae bacterium]|jgi:SAM-dependent methyltransferase
MITPVGAGAIAHGQMPFHNPISETAIDGLIDRLPLQPGDEMLDVGCGRGELLIRIAKRHGTGGFGIDTSEEQIAIATLEAAARVPDAALRFEAGDAGAIDAPPSSFALGACVGSTHALGGLQGTLSRLSELVKPGGLVLVGEGFWTHRPERELLEAIGATEDELTDYPTLLAAGTAHGLAPVYAVTSTGADWERYEWAYLFNAECYAREHPDEDGVELLRERVEWTRRRRSLAARDGETLGFALILWRSERSVQA